MPNIDEQLVIRAKAGEKEAIIDICNIYLPYIQMKAEKIWYRITDYAYFECRCVQKLEWLIKHHDPSKSSFDYRAKKLISQAIGAFLERGKSERDPLISIDMMSEKGIEPKTDGGLSKIFTEKIPALASGDQRKELIIEFWREGKSDSDISKLLAQHFGGSSEGHRTFIKRFRTACRKALARQTTLSL